MHNSIKKIKVSNMVSPRTENKVANQFIIETEDGTYFQSYQSIIAFEDKNGMITLDRYSWNYSKTTLKYLKSFLNWSMYTKKEIQKMIDNKEVITESLN